MKIKKVTRKDILFLFISVFLVVFAWIGFSLHHRWVTSTIDEEIQLQLEPIDPTFDMQTIEELRSREDIAPLNDVDETAKSLSPTIAPTPPLSTTITPFAPQATGVPAQTEEINGLPTPTSAIEVETPTEL